MSETPIDTYQTQKYKDITEGNRRKRENPINHLFPFDVSRKIHYKYEERTLGEGKTTDRVFLSAFLSRCEKRNGIHAEKSRNKIQEQTQLKFSSGSKHCRRTLVSHQSFFAHMTLTENHRLRDSRLLSPESCCPSVCLTLFSGTKGSDIDIVLVSFSCEFHFRRYFAVCIMSFVVV